MKPLFRNNRFYNDRSESVVKHAWGVIRTFLHVVRLECMRRRKPFLPKNMDLSRWFAKDPSYPRSIKPAITWLGHASFLIQVGDVNILTDPVLSDISMWYPRQVQAPLKLEELPPVDVILISHNHMDHMDDQTLRKLAKINQSLLLVPQGDAAYVKRLSFTNVQEFAWDVQAQHKDVAFTFLPAAHWSGKGVFSINKSLWGSWMIEAAGKTIYFGGDTKYGQHFSWIGNKYQGIDIALLPIGPLHPTSFMKGSHVDAAQAVQAFLELKADVFIPMHWGTFRPANDFFDEPVQMLKKSWQQDVQAQDKKLCSVKFGERVSFE